MVRAYTWAASAVLLAITAATADAATRVVVLPFTGATPDAARDAWIGPAVQQNMLMTLGQSRGILPVAARDKPAAVLDAPAAARSARATQAALAVYGTYEVAEGQVRLTAQVVSAATGEPVGGARASGAVGSLLRVEDQLAEQIRQQVGQQIALAETAADSPISPPARHVAEVLENRWEDRPAYRGNYFSSYGWWYPLYSWRPVAPVICAPTVAWLSPGWSIVWNNGNWQVTVNPGGWPCQTPPPCWNPGWQPWGDWNGGWAKWYPNNATAAPAWRQPVATAPPAQSRALPARSTPALPELPTPGITPPRSRGGIGALPGSSGWTSSGTGKTPLMPVAAPVSPASRALPVSMPASRTLPVASQSRLAR